MKCGKLYRFEENQYSLLLNRDSHAHQMVRALDDGPKGWQVGKADGHGKNFGTMMLAVRRRARVLLGLEGDPKSYPCHDYALDNEPRPGPKHIHSHIHPHIHPPPRHQRRSTTAPTSRRELYHAAFTDITLDSGTSYACMQSDLEATGGLSRQSYPEDSSKDRRASKRKWFSQPNHGPFVTPRQASRDIFEHNDPRRKPDKYERGAIERLSNAIEAGRHGDWSPDLIIKAFCDLDTVFFGGRLRGHVCVRWQPDWSPPASGETVYLGDGKCSIRLNADDLLLKHPRAFERMFLTTLHEMW